MRQVVRGFVLLVVGLVLVGAWASPAWAAPKTVAELQALACGAQADGLAAARAAAGQLLAAAWSDIAGNAQALPTTTLNAAIADANVECREAAVDALAQRVLTEGAPFNAAKIQATVDSAKAAASFELGLVRARVGVELVRAGFAERGAAEAIRRAEAVAGGGTETIRGVKLDGSVPAVRAAVARYYLTGFYRFFSNIVFGDAKATCEALSARAGSGASVDIQAAAAAAYVAGVVVDRKETKCVSGDGLVTASLKGSGAVQLASVNGAGDVLAAKTALTLNALQQLAIGKSGRDVQAALLLCRDANDETTCEATSSVAFRLAAARAYGLRVIAAGSVNEAAVRTTSRAHQDVLLGEFATFAVPVLAFVFSR
jgi:hypothetical protein